MRSPILDVLDDPLEIWGTILVEAVYCLGETRATITPVIAKMITVSGEFKRNGIFEMETDENLTDLIRFTGGFTQDADWSNIKIYRKTLTGREILDIHYDEAEGTMLFDGDQVNFIFFSRRGIFNFFIHFMSTLISLFQ